MSERLLTSLFSSLCVYLRILVTWLGWHLVGAGAQFDNPRFFPNLDNAIEKAKTQAELHGVNKVFMTEYANLQNHKQTDPLTLARTIHKCLTKGKCGMYLNWDLAW